MTHLGDPEKPSSLKAILGVLLILAALGVLGVIGFYNFKLSRNAGLTANLCPADGPVAHLAILLDTTDPLAETHLLLTRRILEKEIADAIVGTRLSFSTVSPDLDVRKNAFFSICKPPAGEDASWLSENRRLVEERYKTEFVNPVFDTLGSLLTIPEAPSSPIMESLPEFASRILGFTTTDRPRKLVLMSDLLQNSDVFSFYRGGNWTSFSNANGPERFGFSFNGADITILRIPRNVEVADIVDDFWVRYLMLQGFDNINVTRIGDL